MKGKTLVIVVFLIVLLIVAAFSFRGEDVAAEEATPAPAESKGVKRVEEAGVALTVEEVERTKANDIWEPDPGYIFLNISVLIENIERDELHYNPLQFSLKDGDGFEYSASLFSKQPSLKDGDLAKGEKVRGYITFEIPETSSGLVLRFETALFMGEMLKIDIGEEREEPAPTPTPREATPVPPSTSPPAGLGESRDNPVPVGVPFLTSDGFEWTVVGVDFDAWPEVQAENQFNDPPAEGNRMIMVTLKVTNVSSEEEPAHVSSYDWELLGSKSVLYDTSCGVIPDGSAQISFMEGVCKGTSAGRCPRMRPILELFMRWATASISSLTLGRRERGRPRPQRRARLLPHHLPLASQIPPL